VPHIFDSLVNNQILLDELQKVFTKHTAQIFVLGISNIGERYRVLAQRSGFTDEQLDFIINYDIRYRMGDELSGDGGEGEYE
jgi:hypothetical protein